MCCTNCGAQTSNDDKYWCVDNAVKVDLCIVIVVVMS